MMRRWLDTATMAMIAIAAGFVFIALAIVAQDEQFWRGILLR